MAASKPTSWLSVQLHILCATESGLGTLADGLGCLPLDHEAYPPRSDSRAWRGGIRSLTDVGIPVRTLDQSVLYPRRPIHEANPKAISKRTSYHQV